tara:strand:+ start:730 stop:3717 length:2988 start_codon:yes stop_codon:yes gene_type:complete
MSSPQTYNQTILVDCNRFSSVEYNASKLSQVDNARFTNKVSDGITLDIGDQVSIANAHIAQRGAGASVIEFRGKILGKKNVSYTETTNSSYIGYDDTYADTNTIPQQSPTGYAYETSENIEEEIDIKDNEITMVVEYYKNANGENYIGLPRNFGNFTSAQIDDVAGITGYPDYNTTIGTSPASVYWEQPDGYPVGLSNFVPNASHIFNDDFRLEAEGFNACGSGTTVLKLKNDNSRYTFFKQSEIVWNASQVTSASNAAYLSGSISSGISGQQPDPALHKYIRVKQKVTLSVPEGYNSPSNIAATITDQLTKTDDPIIIGYGPEDGIGNTSRREGGTGQLVNATLNKALPSVNYRNFNSKGNMNFFNASQTGSPNYQILNVGTSSLNNVYSTNYLNSYAYVGFKRPDFVENGRDAFTYAGNIVNDAISSGSTTNAVIKTNILWTDDNLLKISKLFDTQKTLYPELIDGGLTNDRSNYETYNTTSSSLSASFRDEARFLHLGLAPLYLPDVLGSDMYNMGIDENPSALLQDPTSCPIFIYFNKNCSHLNSTSNGDTYNNLAYGFARKYTDGGNTYIAFTTERIGGIHINYFSAGTISDGARIGYDYHFSGYGNAAIIPSTGYFALQYYGHQKFQGVDYIRHSYIGADNPLFNFDTVENRFELSNLHTAEKVGNFYNAGDPIEHSKKVGDLQNVLAPPPADQAGLDCYKMNKQLSYTTWSPSMFPYSPITANVSAVTGENAGTGFIEPNKNLDIGTTFDSRSGVTIVDSGVGETNFDQSLWGLLGYKYSQFNASGDNIKNSNTRFTNVITNVSGITTNANIISTDPINYVANAWSSQLWTSQANSGILYYEVAQLAYDDLTVSNASNIIAPPTTIVATSTTIKASALPRKLLRGYFTLNSDILDQTGFYHQANPMSIMASVGKFNAASDFISYDGGGPVFTVTRKKTITSITSQINDPEGSIAQVGDNSGIVYRIDKVIKADLNFADNVLAGVYGKQ